MTHDTPPPQSERPNQSRLNTKRPEGWRVWILTLGYLGYSPYMPGTLASAVVLGWFILVVELFPFFAVQWILPIVALVTALLGLGLAPYAQKIFSTQPNSALPPSLATASPTAEDQDALENKDPQVVVIDEVVGMTIALLPLLFVVPAEIGMLRYEIYAIATFGFFRLFDIYKPGWIGRLNERTESRYIVLDDVAAGGAAAFVMYLIITL